MTDPLLLDDEQQRPSDKPILESLASLDVRVLKRNGVLRCGAEADLRFRTVDGTPRGHVGVAVSEDALIVSFDDMLEGRRHRQTILFAPVECQYGGHKKLLLCSSCGKRRVALYLFGMRFRCRVCNNSRYWSQCKHEPDRMRERAQQIRERMGGTRNLMLPFPARPKGMHWVTYLAAFEDCERAERIWSGYLVRRLPGRTDR